MLDNVSKLGIASHYRKSMLSLKTKFNVKTAIGEGNYRVLWCRTTITGFARTINAFTVLYLDFSLSNSLTRMNQLTQAINETEPDPVKPLMLVVSLSDK